MKKNLKVGNAQAFWGDERNAPRDLINAQPDLDYLTLDYLSEVSLSIMAAQREKNPHLGYAHDFLNVIKSMIPIWNSGIKVKIITNAGGLNPKECAKACLKLLKQESCSKRIGIVSGDDVFEIIKKNPDDLLFKNLETGESIVKILGQLSTANAYFGAKPIVDALQKGADLVISGRVADPSLTVAPCMAHFQWQWNEYDKIAQATLAGHLIECGTQVTGGVLTNWLEIPPLPDFGFPFVEVFESGSFVITKPKGTGGIVSIETVKEQILYEIGDPNAYLSPDVTLSLLSVSLKSEGKDRILVSGAKGRQPPSTYKVSASYQDGYKAEATLAIFGKDVIAKARRCGEIILERVRKSGYQIERSLIECLGGGDLVPRKMDPNLISQLRECVLRICIADSRIEVLENFACQIAPIVTCGPQGTTGYTSGKPHIRSVFGYWPCLIDSKDVNTHIEFIES